MSGLSKPSERGISLEIEPLGGIERFLSTVREIVRDKTPVGCKQHSVNFLIAQVREVLANYKKNELLIRIGEYKPGSDKAADFAIKYVDKVNRFLKQKVDEKCTFEETMNQLQTLFR